ncbi:ABC transporter ATP-binding protein [Qaidamihabitans albus]|uniref:ABC transporter ATP-binding protein n=1 Tax=Qaidamihabitans albus TaxID=2795733 RepID=UPI001F1F2C48|nr:ABC transporter ATP-binding protein [Qaidamihabitans albus]
MTQHNPPQECMDQIVISGMTKRFGDTTAVDDLNLTVGLGEFMVLLGPSGCGKTTTMRSIAGLESPDEGSIQIGVRTVFDRARKVDLSPHQRNIGMVFQSYAIWPHRNVFDNVAFPLRMQRLDRKQVQQRVEEILELVGLAGLGKRPASMLSGGQMQRVALARSVVMQPAVLLLDEPLSNLDAKLREHLRVELRQTQQRLGTTAVYVTHDQAEALALADRIVLMRDGRIEQISTPLEMYRNPQTRFAAEFIGTNNVVAGKATEDTGGLHVAVDGGLSLVSSSTSVPGDLVVCLRAEDLIIDPPSSFDGNIIEGTVEVVNLLGSQVLYAVRVAGATLEVLAPLGATLLRRGDHVALGITPDNVRCFPED